MLYEQQDDDVYFPFLKLSTCNYTRADETCSPGEIPLMIHPFAGTYTFVI